MRARPRLDILPMWIGVTTTKETLRVSTDPSVWERVVAGGFVEIAPIVRELVERTGIRGSKVEVVVESKSGAIELLTLPVGYRESVNAAEMRLRDGLGTADAVTAVCGVGGEKPGTRGPTTLLMAGETTARIEALDRVLREAGIRATRIIPARALAMSLAVAHVRSVLPARAAAVLWLGPSGTVLAGGSGSMCSFARVLSAGYDMLVDAVHRAAAVSPGLDLAASASRLISEGIPTRGSMMGADLPADRVLLHLQPVLQRLGIELKQSLRFGLPEGEANRVELLLAGEGARIPGLASALSSMIDTSARVCDPGTEPNATDLVLVPPAAKRSAARRRLAVAAVLGLAVAGTAVGADAAWSRGELQRVRADIDKNKTLLARAETDRSDHERLRALTYELGRLDALTEGTLGAKPSWAASLAMLASLDLPGMQIHEITSGGPERGSTSAATLTIKGLIPVSGENDGSISEVLERLRSSPLTAQVRPGSTRLVDSEVGRALYFSATLKLETLDARTRLSWAQRSGGMR